MTSREYVLDMMHRVGLAAAQSLQSRAAELTGTEVYAEQSAVPDFDH